MKHQMIYKGKYLTKVVNVDRYNGEYYADNNSEQFPVKESDLEEIDGQRLVELCQSEEPLISVLRQRGITPIMVLDYVYSLDS